MNLITLLPDRALYCGRTILSCICIDMIQQCSCYLQDAAEAITVNTSEIMGCQVNVALASNLGGVGTHPLIMQQVCLPCRMA